MVVSTVPDDVTAQVASTLSVHVAPASVYDAFFTRVMVLLPERVMVGAILSRVTVTVPVAVLPEVSAIVTTGLLVRIFPVQRIVPVASAGVGEQLRPGIVSVAPDSVAVQVTVVAPLVVDGDAVHVGIDGGVISTTFTTRDIEPVFPAAST